MYCTKYSCGLSTFCCVLCVTQPAVQITRQAHRISDDAYLRVVYFPLLLEISEIVQSNFHNHTPERDTNQCLWAINIFIYIYIVIVCARKSQHLALRRPGDASHTDAERSGWCFCLLSSRTNPTSNNTPALSAVCFFENPPSSGVCLPVCLFYRYLCFIFFACKPHIKRNE